MKIAIQVVALLVAVLPTQLHAAPKVLQLNAERLNALELEAFEPWPDSFVISGVSEHAEKELHRGEFVVSVSRQPWGTDAPTVELDEMEMDQLRALGYGVQ